MQSVMIKFLANKLHIYKANDKKEIKKPQSYEAACMLFHN